MPVLSDLVVCYKDTYDRYRAGIEEHDKMRMDIDVIKIVLGEHDQVIKKISQKVKKDGAGQRAISTWYQQSGAR